MNAPTREPQAPESYATFWEPLAADAAPVQTLPPPADADTAPDAYQEFTELTEGVPAVPRRART